MAVLQLPPPASSMPSTSSRAVPRLDQVQQIVIAFVAGSVLYITRRVAGTLIVCMVLHAWIDFTTFAFSDAAGDAESPFLILSFFQWFAFVLAIVGVVMVLRRGSDQRDSTPDARAAA